MPSDMSKPYAQWPEFDGLTDVQAAQVYRFAAKVKESPAERARRLRIAIPFALGFLAIQLGLIWFDVQPSRRGRHPIAPVTGVVFAFVGFGLVQARTTRNLRHRVRELIQRCTCSCGYSMLGVPPIAGAHPPAVRCPECGETHLVSDLPAHSFETAPNGDR